MENYLSKHIHGHFSEHKFAHKVSFNAIRAFVRTAHMIIDVIITYAPIDPYAVVKFGRYTKCSQIANETVSPKWDQTLVFRYISLYGDPAALFSSPPLVVVELFDHDIVVCDLIPRDISIFSKFPAVK